jgi:hypothetical protein
MPHAPRMTRKAPADDEKNTSHSPGKVRWIFLALQPQIRVGAREYVARCDECEKISCNQCGEMMQYCVSPMTLVDILKEDGAQN